MSFLIKDKNLLSTYLHTIDLYLWRIFIRAIQLLIDRKLLTATNNICYNIYHINNIYQIGIIAQHPSRHTRWILSKISLKKKSANDTDRTEFWILIRNHHQAIVRRWYSGLITCLVDNAHPQDRNDAWAPTPCVIYVREIDRASKARPISVSVENGRSIKGSGSGKGIYAPWPCRWSTRQQGSGRRKLFINHRGVYPVVGFNGRAARCVKPQDSRIWRDAPKRLYRFRGNSLKCAGWLQRVPIPIHLAKSRWW